MKKHIINFAVAFFMIGAVSSHAFDYSDDMVDAPAVAAPSVTAEEMYDAVNASSENLKREIKTSRAIERRHHRKQMNENGQFRGAFKKMAEKHTKESGWLGEQAYNNAWVLGIAGLLATILIVAVVVICRTQIMEALGARASVAPAPAPVTTPGTPTDPAGTIPVAVAVPAAITELAETEARVNDRFDEVVSLIVSSTNKVIAEVPVKTDELISKLKPMVIFHKCPTGEEIVFSPEIEIGADGKERYVTAYVPKVAAGPVPANVADIIRMQTTDKKSARKSSLDAFDAHFAKMAAGTALVTDQEKHQASLIERLKGTAVLSIS